MYVFVLGCPPSRLILGCAQPRTKCFSASCLSLVLRFSASFFFVLQVVGANSS